MAVITNTDLQRFMNRTFTSGEQTAATSIISGLERQLSMYLNAPISPVQVVDEVQRLKVNQRQIFLRKAPVIEVTSFYVGIEDHEVEQNISDFYIYPWGIDNVRITGDGYRAIVSYTAGMPAEDVENLGYIMLSASSRDMNKVLLDAQGLARMNVENSQYFMSEKGQSGFTDAELKMASKYKRRNIK